MGKNSEKVIYKFFSHSNKDGDKSGNFSIKVFKKVDSYKQEEIFAVTMDLFKTLEFLEDSKDQDSYEFYDECFVINKTNIKKIQLVLGKLVDHYLTDGIIGDIPYFEIEKEISRIEDEDNYKYNKEDDGELDFI